MKFPIKYQNGNYIVSILKDGTKIQKTIDDNATEFLPDRPETLDINTSNYCENNCPYCYIDATVKGKHGNLEHPFFDTIPPYTEIALNYAKHDGIESLLYRMRQQDVISNITVHQIDLERDWEKIFNWQQSGLIHGIGISIVKESAKLRDIVKLLNNVVAHTINGVTKLSTFKYISTICNKVLILGFKRKGRGINTKEIVNTNISSIKNLFSIISYDNLAIDQIKRENICNDTMWENSFMGDEGSHSFFIDTVTQKFFESSTDDTGYAIDNLAVNDMFKKIRSVL